MNIFFRRHKLCLYCLKYQAYRKRKLGILDKNIYEVSNNKNPSCWFMKY